MEIGHGAVNAFAVGTVGDVKTFLGDFGQHATAVGFVDACPGCKKILAFGQFAYPLNGGARPFLCFVKGVCEEGRPHCACRGAALAVRFVEVELHGNATCQQRRPKLRGNSGKAGQHDYVAARRHPFEEVVVAGKAHGAFVLGLADRTGEQVF